MLRNLLEFMCDTCKGDGPVRNAYKDEQEKIDDRFKIELELSFKLSDLLERYGYDLEARLVGGLPEIQLVKTH